MLGSPDSVASLPETALYCLVSVAGHHGIDLSVDRLRHSYAIGDVAVSQVLLLRMAKDAGLRARATRLTWDALIRLGEAYPALARLANGNWVVVAGACQDAAGQDAVIVSDPLAERPETLVIAKESFCAKWQGDVMLVKRSRRL